MLASASVVDRLPAQRRRRPPIFRTVRIFRIASLAALALLARPAGAIDGPVWTFEVRDVVEIDETSHVITLVPAPRGLEYPRTCRQFVIHAQLSLGQGVPIALYRHFDREGYGVAIQKIQQARIEDQLLRLGSLDRGFGLQPDSDDECEVRSAGLGLLPDADAHDAIFSVY